MNTKTELRFRQIHLDYHTSQYITHIGEEFDADEFADTLEKAHVNSVTCFARCHHGYIYFDSKKHPERKHPHLKRNLLAEQIEACHARGIQVPIYTTIQWDHFTADQHPEWLALQADGKILGTPPYEPGFYRYLCINSPYVDFLKEHIQEVLETFPVDGFFLDIVQPLDDSSIWTRRAMQTAGLDPSSEESRKAFGLNVLNHFKEEMTAFIRKFNQECTIFYNAGHIGPLDRDSAPHYTHFELESLPGGDWGYQHFPLVARYARTLGLDCLGMTGKFHTSWGDFHSFKNPAALQFECYRMLAFNTKCSIGDQLHPSGKICRTTYDLIGRVYSQVEKKEPWCIGAKPVTEIGLLTTEEQNHLHQPDETCGAVQMLQEGNYQFDIVDSFSNFTNYRVLILPDQVPVTPDLADKLDTYLREDGALLASYHSGLNSEGDAFALKALGITYRGEAPYCPDFIIPRGPIGQGLPETEHVMYLRGLEVMPVRGCEILEEAIMPYFNRTYAHFCSHRHTPSSGQKGYPSVLRNGRCIYFIHPIFTQYNKNAPYWVKIFFHNALNLLLPDPLVQIQGPSSLVVTLNMQPALNRLVLHLLHYIPERRGRDFDTIEDVIPLYDIPVSVRTDCQVKQVCAVPQMEPIGFEQKDNRIDFTVPGINGHQMIEIALN